MKVIPIVQLSVALGLAALTAGAFGATPLPHFNVNAFCKQASTVDGTYSASLDNSCFDEEQSSYNALKAGWQKIPESAKKFCLNAVSGQFTESYSLLKSCVDEESSALHQQKGRKFQY